MVNEVLSFSQMYRLMIYFAHSTLVMYSGSIKINKDSMSISEFRNANADVLKRVTAEALSIMNYELSYNQMEKAIAVYLQSTYNPQRIEDTEVAVLTE